MADKCSLGAESSRDCAAAAIRGNTVTVTALASASDLTNFFRVQGKDGWKAFYESHPDSSGWIELSAVGFNADKTVAVIYHGHHCGNLCGGGGFTVLRKKEGKWQPWQFKGAGCAWAS